MPAQRNQSIPKKWPVESIDILNYPVRIGWNLQGVGIGCNFLGVVMESFLHKKGVGGGGGGGQG